MAARKRLQNRTSAQHSRLRMMDNQQASQNKISEFKERIALLQSQLEQRQSQITALEIDQKQLESSEH